MASDLVRRYYLTNPKGTCSVELNEHLTFVHTKFVSDGMSCVFAPPRVETKIPGVESMIDGNYLAASIEMGYSDPMRYAVEHEIAHHLVAWERGHEYSRIVHNAAHNVAQSMEQPESASEEHLVNHLQKFVNFGTVDTQYGQLVGTFGKRGLATLGRRLLFTARPWLVY